MRRAAVPLVLLLTAFGVVRADVRAGEAADAEAAYERGEFAAALEAWRGPAERGDPEAQYGLGRLYFYGQSVAQDYRLAAEWYERAALQDHARSQANLGHLYENGLGVEQDLVVAARWYRAAAEQGRAVAQRSLGRMYEEGRGVEKDLAEARRWYTRAAEQGDAEARAALEAALGDPEAEYRKAGNYRAGIGVDADIAEAGKWYKRAAEHGHGEAMYALAFLYLRGRGVCDRSEQGLAHGWFVLAAERGIGDAAAWRDKLGRRLTPKEREQSAKLIQAQRPS